jgi:hypothetical protein
VIHFISYCRPTMYQRHVIVQAFVYTYVPYDCYMCVCMYKCMYEYGGFCFRGLNPVVCIDDGNPLWKLL